MYFVGVDLAWTAGGGTGLCAVEDNAVLASARLGTNEEILDWLEALVRGDVLLAVDAPLVVRNLTGRRRAEQLISRCFGALHASAHSSNLSLTAFRDGGRGKWLAAALDLDVDPSLQPKMPVRRAIEVYPHTAIVVLFGLASTLKYKAKHGRTLQSRAAALNQLLDHLESLESAVPPLVVRVSPRWSELRAIVANPSTGAELARAEDEIDAYVCAYTGLYYWTHGDARCRVVGDATDGYIVTPVTPGLAGCLDRMSSRLASDQELATAQGASDVVGSGRVHVNASRVLALLPEAVVTITPHVAQLVSDGDRGVVVLVTAETIELRLPTVEWTAGTHRPAQASRAWKRLKVADLSDEALSSEIGRACATRSEEFAVCRYCGERVPIEFRISDDLCHACASRHEGVVF